MNTALTTGMLMTAFPTVGSAGNRTHTETLAEWDTTRTTWAKTAADIEEARKDGRRRGNTPEKGKMTPSQEPDTDGGSRSGFRRTSAGEAACL